MRTAGNKAFTMVELLIVILIIAILVTLVVPGIVRAVELAKQATCNTNVKAILAGLQQYASGSEEMPIVPASKWDVEIGTNRGVSPFALPGLDPKDPMPRNNSSNLWLLAREDHVSFESFVCPATTDTPDKKEDTRKLWDFRSALRVSYGLQNPYGWDGSLSVITPAGVALVADGSPYIEPYSGKTNGGKIRKNVKVAQWGGGGDGDQLKLQGNSPNHISEGQNVGYNDGHALWQEVASCGKDGDNIYSANGERNVAKQRTETSPDGVLKSDSKNNENDTLIWP
jgi:prepilin-type N-terminal cleavage/methylation domain-containing protein